MFIPGCNAAKLIGQAAGLNFNFFQNGLSGKSIITAGPTPFSAAAALGGKQVWKSTVTVESGGNTLVDIGRTAPLPFQKDLLATFNQQDFRTPNLSESRVPTGDWDPNLWLAWLGVTWIRIAGQFAHKLWPVVQRMGQLPNLEAGRSGLVLMIQGVNCPCH